MSRQNMKQKRFVTHRAFVRALPPSLGLRFSPSTVPLFLSPLRGWVKDKN
jgi:hypothetical protein